ncbi:5,10-methylenetetrahydrofolate reductase [mine drainage metagenome]|uniref:methylenetetrahydrofolate reductase (NADH) n=1 Tax=mine drainage metagenome TaxID=410659 RepID=A0A1J5PN50_9ZZZZ
MPVENPTISFEFFPPKDELGEMQLWQAIDALHSINPDFVSVTYGAGGSTRDRTVRIACEIYERAGFRTIAHLTCVGSTREELKEILLHYKESGISDVLALRGDPVDGPTAPWTATVGGLDHAEQLVELASEVGDFTIGVAAFPDIHPASNGNFEQDIEVLLRKERAGATFAITQFVFDSQSYARLVETLKERGSALTIYPGIMPVTNHRQIKRMIELSGGHMPAKILEKFDRFQDDPESVKSLGIEVATQICEEVYLTGAEGFHFYTLNSATATAQVIGNLSMYAR